MESASQDATTPTLTPSVTFQRSLVIHDMLYFRACLEATAGKVEEGKGLWDQIGWLLSGEFFRAEELHLFKDFALHSFEFSFKKEGRTVMNGGIILHGFGNETFSVELVGSDKPHYSIHT